MQSPLSAHFATVSDDSSHKRGAKKSFSYFLPPETISEGKVTKAFFPAGTILSIFPSAPARLPGYGQILENPIFIVHTQKNWGTGTNVRSTRSKRIRVVGVCVCGGGEEFLRL